MVCDATTDWVTSKLLIVAVKALAHVRQDKIKYNKLQVTDVIQLILFYRSTCELLR